LTKHRRREQVNEMCLMDELMPSIGTSGPSPSLFAVVISQADSTLQNVTKHFADAQDIKLWNWRMTSECPTNNLKDIQEPKSDARISLVGQLHLLSSTVTMLAVPSPSLTVTLATANFSVHNSLVRGLRWLGKTRLVSFSYTQVNEKSGGFVNKLVVTCLTKNLKFVIERIRIATFNGVSTIDMELSLECNHVKRKYLSRGPQGIRTM
ncbi:WD repeat-containing protein 11-like protein, partial [Tanacetum coccineum]